MTWRQLEAWASKNGFLIVEDDDPTYFAATWINLHKDIHSTEQMTVRGTGTSMRTAKRALCRAVARILESER